jgi:hypothetical protein
VRRERLPSSWSAEFSLARASVKPGSERLAPAETGAGFAEHEPQIARRLSTRAATGSSSGEAPPAARSSRRTSRASSTSWALESVSPKNMRAVSGS